MLNSEFDEYMGYDKYDQKTDKTNYRNGTYKKTVKTSQGNMDLNIPRDRNSSFDPVIIEKHNRDIRFPWDVLTVFWKFHYDNYLF